MTTNEKKYIEMISKYVARYAPKHGIMCYSAIIAQAILESGWGKSALATRAHNHFGLKCGSAWAGKSINLKTGEFVSGSYVKVRDNFRAYDTDDQGVKGYFNFISTARYSNLKGVTDPREYLEKIKADGYATSPNYVENVYKVVEKYNLRDYDPCVTESTKKTEKKKSTDEIAREVINGRWLNGEARKRLLTEAGYNYAEVQKRVNKILNKK